MENQEKETTEQQISRDMLINPPPNHNPLIGLLHADTLNNIHDSLTALQQLTVSPPQGEPNLNPAAGNGLYFLICCIKDALRFEIEYRDRLK